MLSKKSVKPPLVINARTLQIAVRLAGPHAHSTNRRGVGSDEWMPQATHGPASGRPGRSAGPSRQSRDTVWVVDATLVESGFTWRASDPGVEPNVKDKPVRESALGVSGSITKQHMSNHYDGFERPVLRPDVLRPDPLRKITLT